MVLKINESVSIIEEELQEDFIRSSGPGGQNVNKVSSAVQLRFNIKESQSLSTVTRQRLVSMLDGQLTQEGELVVIARESRSQKDNRSSAREKLAKIIQKALYIPKVRKKTKPTKASQERRIASKQKRGEHKKMRSKPQF